MPEWLADCIIFATGGKDTHWEAKTNLVVRDVDDALNGAVKAVANKAVATGKELVKDAITISAEEVYDYIESHQLSPETVAFINKEIVPHLKNISVNTQPDTMTWANLVTAWFLEKGPRTMKFTEKAKTTRELMKHQGVNEARKLAMRKYEDLKGTDSTEECLVPHQFTFGTDVAWKTLRTRDTLAVALGSYGVTVRVQYCPEGERGDDGKYYYCKLSFTVNNTNGWASATRYRKGNNPGEHLGILADRRRGGPGIQLGGNLDETWTWEEFVDEFRPCGQ
jgi:hypothetical protein